MKWTLYHLSIVTAILIAGIVVQLQPSVAATIELGVGESRTVGSEGLVVGFENILHDSRCPLGVFCIWEGDAGAQIWSDHPTEPKTVVELHTHGGFQRDFDFAGYNIALTKVIPYPVYGEFIDPDEYVVRLTVSGGPAAPVEDTTWSRIKALYR
jgi:hypothetical protein